MLLLKKQFLLLNLLQFLKLKRLKKKWFRQKKQLWHTQAGKSGSRDASEHQVLMPFGKFKGQPVNAVRLGYLIWVWQSGRSLSDRLLEAVQSRLWEVGYWNDYMAEENWPEGF